MGLAPCNHLEELGGDDERTLQVAQLPSRDAVAGSAGVLGADKISLGEELLVLSLRGGRVATVYVVPSESAD